MKNFEKITTTNNIYFFWNDGFNILPPIVELCLKLWEILNPEYKIIKLDNKDLQSSLMELGLSHLNIPIQPLSDIFRLYLLYNYGGIWVDATLLPVVPLSKWFPKNFVQKFFAFRCHHAPYCLISSWFLASIKRHKIVEKWLEETISYWNKDRKLYKDPREGNPTPENPLQEVFYNRDKSNIYPYFFLHYLFTGVILKNNELRKIWDFVPPISSTPFHSLQNYMKKNKILKKENIKKIISKSLVEKLDWRVHNENIQIVKNIILSENSG